MGWMVRYVRSLAIWRWYTDFFPIKIVSGPGRLTCFR
jgi:hypothetical protein